MKIYHVIGLMSGTSLDGLDICHAKFSYPSYDFQIVEAETITYNQEWKNRLKNSIYLSAEKLQELHSDYGFFLGEAVYRFIKDKNIKNIDCIASHGHTVFHNPKSRYTLQIGHGAAIAAKTCIRTVCDFRAQDVLLGGQGAPLVPIGDQLLFPQYDACLNLGGFSNISFNQNGKRTAFDVCPVNIVLNFIAKLENQDFDRDGILARKGKIILPLLNKLNKLEYYSLLPPKSLGIEWCVKNIFSLIENSEESAEDLLATFTLHIAEKIAETINSNHLKNVLTTGGGAKNPFLMELIKAKNPAEIFIPDEELIDFKEALIFAFMGMLRLENQVNILSSVTGAVKNHSSGIIYDP